MFSGIFPSPAFFLLLSASAGELCHHVYHVHVLSAMPSESPYQDRTYPELQEKVGFGQRVELVQLVLVKEGDEDVEDHLLVQLHQHWEEKGHGHLLVQQHPWLL